MQGEARRHREVTGKVVKGAAGLVEREENFAEFAVVEPAGAGKVADAAMVEAGWAVADLRRSSRYFPQQAKAQSEGLGLWRNNFAYPEQWRLAARGEAC